MFSLILTETDTDDLLSSSCDFSIKLENQLTSIPDSHLTTENLNIEYDDS
jgi:hypothetical protein